MSIRVNNNNNEISISLFKHELSFGGIAAIPLL